MKINKKIICIFLLFILISLNGCVKDKKGEMPGLEEGFNQVNFLGEERGGFIPKIKSFISKIGDLFKKKDKNPRGEMPGLEEGFNQVNVLEEEENNDERGFFPKIKAFINRIFRRG